MAGQNDKCPACGREHTVPQPRSRKPLILIGGGVIVLGLIALALIPQLKRSEPKPVHEDSSGQPPSKVAPAVSDSKLAKGLQIAADSPRPADSAKKVDKKPAPDASKSAQPPALPSIDEQRLKDFIDEQLKDFDRRVRDEQLSKKCEETFRTAFKALLSEEIASPSSNQFIEQRRQEEMASTRANLRKIISQDFPVIGWSFVAIKVQQDGPGRAILTGSFVMVEGEDGHLGDVEGVFCATKQECLDKLKVLQTPLFIYVYGTCRGMEADERVLGHYTLKFDLDDIRPVFTKMPASKP
jgi:hypothetical protein